LHQDIRGGGGGGQRASGAANITLALGGIDQ